MNTDTVTIRSLGFEGDGIADGPSGAPIYVPFALPGETVANGGAGAVTPSSPDRATPPCRHFGSCGGCTVQHLRDGLYVAWKEDMVRAAFKQQGLTPTIEPLVRVAPQSRRRAAFSLLRNRDGRYALGYHRRRDAAVLPLQECPVLSQRIVAALPGLAALAGKVPGISADTRFQVADLTGGIDLNIQDAARTLTAAERANLAVLASTHGIARVALDGDVIFASADITLPTRAGAIPLTAGGFFQAAEAAETAIVDQIMSATSKAKRIVDLFAGMGTLTLPLAQKARVLAVDSEQRALDAIPAAMRRNQGLKPIEIKLRDLQREPLSVLELAPFDMAVADPPRAGCKAQAEMLARSKVRTIAMVSCNPTTLARDVRILVDGGYRLERVTPIDQFLWTGHVEAVAILKR